MVQDFTFYLTGRYSFIFCFSGECQLGCSLQCICPLGRLFYSFFLYKCLLCRVLFFAWGGLGPASMVYWLWRCAYGLVLWFIVCSFGSAGFVVTGSGSILSVFNGFFSSCGRQAVIMR